MLGFLTLVITDRPLLESPVRCMLAMDRPIIRAGMVGSEGGDETIDKHGRAGWGFRVAARAHG